MKLHLPKALLTAVIVAAQVHAAYYYNSADYDTFSHSNVNGDVTITVGNGDYSKFDIFNTALADSPTCDDGVIIGAAALKDKKGNDLPYVSHDASVNAAVNSVNLTIDGATGIKKVLGMGFKNSYVTGPVNITVNSGEVETIVGGVDFISGSNATYSGEGNRVYKSPDTDINITVNGGTVGQIRGTHNTSSNAKVYPQINDAINAGTLDTLMADNPWAIGGNVTIKVLGGTVGNGEKAILGGGGNGFSVDGAVSITIGALGEEGPTINGDVLAGSTNIYTSVGSTNVTINSGTINGDVYAGGDYDGYDGLKKGASLEKVTAAVNGDTSLTVAGGTVNGNVYGAGKQDDVTGSTSVAVTGGTIEGDVFGAGDGGTVGGDSKVVIDGGDVNGNVYGAGNGSVVKGNASVCLLSGNVTGAVDADGINSVVEGESVIQVGTDEQAYRGTVGDISGFDQIIVSKGSAITLSAGNVFSTANMTITLSDANLKQAAISGAYAAVGAEGLTLNIEFVGPATSGKYMIAQADSFSKGRATASTEPEGWDRVIVTGVCTLDDLSWEGTTLYLTYRDLSIDAAVVSNWGVFKSSQAFVNALWNQRGDNAVSLDVNDGKDGMRAETKNIAWGSVYGQDGRICDTADYNTYGVAVGAERQFSKNRSLGLALGYAWGEVSPFATSKVDQESAYLAMYGCAGAWNMYKGCLSVDWSVAVGDTTSESKEYSGDWSQTSWQLDARATYSRAISERTTASAFVGAQYYTHDSAEVDGVSISGMDNLRLFVGGGLNRKVSNRTSIYGEASVFADVLRDNPSASVNGATFENNNPGRVGGKISVGASYSISDKWSARGGYSFEVADDNTEHNLNLGASYSF